MSDEIKNTHNQKVDLLSSLQKSVSQANPTVKNTNNHDDSWEDYSDGGEEETNDQKEPKISLISENSTTNKNKPTGLKDILANENKPNYKGNKKNKNYNIKKPYSNQQGTGFQKPTYFNSQNTGGSLINNNSYYNNKEKNFENKTNTNTGNYTERNTGNYTERNTGNYTERNTNSFGERKVFKNSQPQKLEELSKDPKIDVPQRMEEKSEISKKLNIVGELLKQTSIENEKFNPPKNLYIDKDLDVKYSNSNSGAKTTRNYDTQYQKKFENSQTAASSATTVKQEKNDKYDDLQKPVFTSKKNEGGANFVEIKNDGDLFYKKLKEQGNEDDKDRYPQPKHSDDKNNKSTPSNKKLHHHHHNKNVEELHTINVNKREEEVHEPKQEQIVTEPVQQLEGSENPTNTCVTENGEESNHGYNNYNKSYRGNKGRGYNNYNNNNYNGKYGRGGYNSNNNSNYKKYNKKNVYTEEDELWNKATSMEFGNFDIEKDPKKEQSEQPKSQEQYKEEKGEIKECNPENKENNENSTNNNNEKNDSHYYQNNHHQQNNYYPKNKGYKNYYNNNKGNYYSNKFNKDYDDYDINNYDSVFAKPSEEKPKVVKQGDKVNFIQKKGTLKDLLNS